MEEKAKMVAQLLKLLANEHRLLILCALSEGERTVSEIRSLPAPDSAEAGGHPGCGKKGDTCVLPDRGPPSEGSAGRAQGVLLHIEIEETRDKGYTPFIPRFLFDRFRPETAVTAVTDPTSG